MRIRTAAGAVFWCVEAIGVRCCRAVRKRDASGLAELWNVVAIDSVARSALGSRRVLRHITAGSGTIREAHEILLDPGDLSATRARAIRC